MRVSASGDSQLTERHNDRRGAVQASWSANGARVAVPAHDRVELVKADGSLEGQVSVPGLDLSALSCDCKVGWSPGW
jgi:hypothetical protein